MDPDSVHLHMLATDFRAELVLAASLYWKQDAPREVAKCLLDDMFSLVGNSKYLGVGIELFNHARQVWPTGFADPSVCWNCGCHNTSKTLPRLLPYCVVCDPSPQLIRPALWMVQDMMRGYLCNRPTRMQIEAILLQGVRLALSPPVEDSLLRPDDCQLGASSHGL